MDSEKYQEVQELIRDGRHPGDEGPFYHHSFWESYKSAIGGKIGGAVIGALIGAVAGVVAVALLAPFGAFAVVAANAALVIAGFASAGLIYGSHEFGEIGRVTGAVAAAQKDAETRMQAYEKSKFNEIKSEIHELKQIVSGQKPDGSAKAATAKAIDVEKDLNDYRTTHLRRDIPTPKGNSVFFWKIAIAGLFIGAGIGALLAFAIYGTAAMTVAAASTTAAATTGTSAAGASLISSLGLSIVSPLAGFSIAFGALGASLGVNRDIFRKTFDRTDLWFKGIFNYNVGKEGGRFAQPRIDSEDLAAPVRTAPVSTLIYPETSVEEGAKSDTFHRDRVLASAQKALQDLDHTNARAH